MGCDIRTLSSSLPEQRREELRRFLNFYNAVKPHKSINGLTPFETLDPYFNQCKQPDQI